MGYTSSPIITKVEKGEVDLSYSRICKFAEILGVSVPELTGYIDSDFTRRVNSLPKEGIDYMMQQLECSAEEMDTILNKQSGLLGMSEVSYDWRDVDKAIGEGNKKAYLAHKILVNSIVDYVAKYYVELKGQVDALVFTAGLGENAHHIRRMVIDRLNCLGFECDREVNDETRFGKEGIISSKNSKIPVYVIATNEELMMARDAVDLIK